tara:strand:+ start:3979 stop:4500 length:522 start_codon:yes stop_codon:yes gene_type:complete
MEVIFMKLELVKAPSEWLEKNIEPMDINNLPDNLVDIRDQMNEIMVANKGIGLSANQVALDMRLFIFHAEGLQALSSERVNLCINPEVEEYIEPEIEMWEGCLSFPNINLFIKRHHKIKAKWINIHGKETKETLYGYDARCFLHELDHLNGITFDNYVSPIDFKKAKERAEDK